jgi:hypothetical protein
MLGSLSEEELGGMTKPSKQESQNLLGSGSKKTSVLIADKI